MNRQPTLAHSIKKQPRSIAGAGKSVATKKGIRLVASATGVELEKTV